MYVAPRGLVNINQCCWWNSLLQALLSCKYFVITILENNDSNSPTYKAFKKFIRSHLEPDNYTRSNIMLLNIFLNELKEKKNNSFEIFISGQQSVSEGFVVLLDILNSPSIHYLFTHIYEESIVKKNNINECIGCQRQNNNCFYQFDEKDLLKRGLKECLMYTIEDIKDFKVDNKVNPCIKISRLKRISTIFIVLLNKYKMKRSYIPLPSVITMKHKNGTIITFYKKACIDHLGTLESGGHYIARGERNKNIVLFNDTQLENSSLNTSLNTYMIFYESITQHI